MEILSLRIFSLVASIGIMMSSKINETMRCKEKKDDYVENYPDDYFKGVFWSGFVSCILTFFLIITVNVKMFWMIWCFVLNVWLVVNTGFYDMQVKNCLNGNENQLSLLTNYFFIVFSSIVMFYILFNKQLKGMYSSITK